MPIRIIREGKKITMKKTKIKTKEAKTSDSSGSVRKTAKGQVVKLSPRKKKWRLPPVKEYWQRVKEFLGEAVIELKKVTWPGRKETMGATAVVIFLVFVISGFLGIVDLALSKIINQIIK